MLIKNYNDQIIQKLKNHNLCFQTTIQPNIQTSIFTESFYLGIDPSGYQIHIGHIINLLLAKELSKLGMTMILLLGTFTGQIGDPSFKENVRKEITKEEIEYNTIHIQNILVKIIKKLKIKYKILKNNTWLSKLTIQKYIEIAKIFNLKTILNSKIFLSRQNNKNPMYLHEIMYLTIQAYDFLYLNKKYKCNLQIGGQDQWLNMTYGCTLINKLNHKKAHVITVPLLIDENKNKISKTFENNYIYFINLTKSFLFTYINLNKLPNTCIQHINKILEIEISKCDKHDTIKYIFQLIYSKQHYILSKILISQKNKNNININNLNKYTNILDTYNTQTYNLKTIIKKSTNINKNHHITDAINNKSIKINSIIIDSIVHFYQNTKQGINYLEISEYIYIYIFNTN